MAHLSQKSSGMTLRFKVAGRRGSLPALPFVIWVWIEPHLEEGARELPAVRLPMI